MKKKTPSAAIVLLDTVWEFACKAAPHSWDRLNGAMQDALKLCITAGMPFDELDYRHVLEHYRSGYWLGDSDERFYAMAIIADNGSAVASYEAAYGRKAFIADDVKSESGCERQRERLAVGFWFTFGALRPRVTSFAADHIVACTYKPSRDDYDYGRKIDKRLKITHADIIADRAERKERADLLGKLTKAAEANGAKSIVDLLGIKTRDDYAKLPIAKIRKVAEKVLAGAA